MALFGDVGKFFGLGSAGDVAADVTSFFGGGPTAQRVVGGAAQAVSEAVSGGGNEKPDVSTAPRQAGVDSAATVLPVSQTGMLMPQQPGMPGFGQPQMAGVNVMGIPGLVQGAGRLLSKPGVIGTIGGIGATAVVDNVVDMFGNQKKLVITRKLQRDVKKVFMLSGGNIPFVSANSMRLFGKSLSEEQILTILFKTFKNQGPFVTKAAVRKTRATIRKMETLCDLKDRLCPPKRRAPARRRTMSTSITQVK
tara:strand:+ start:760 stop:1512 length:753 start_codon:yes stop_codon:yes gene_type:complete